MKKIQIGYTNLFKYILFFTFYMVQNVKADGYYFFVQFTDKNNSTYSLQQPEEFLSQRAIQRRLNQGISCDSTDLPVNELYLSQITDLGMDIHHTSKWMNSATLVLEDSTNIAQIRALDFVRFVEYTGRKIDPKYAPQSKIKKFVEEYNHGDATTQTDLLNGKVLHNAGYTGKDIHIALLDAGFYQANINTAFDSLRLQNRLLGAVNICDNSRDTYLSDSHGSNVLSIMAANYPNQYLGSAPHASYWLIQTEEPLGEYKVELDFLVRGFEFADSVGIDIVNISLGYYEFDDDRMDFTYADMDGKTARSSIAANIASQKGIIVCSSAGNEGNKAWKYVCSPGDAEGIITVGAVNNYGNIAAFSSFGPSSDQRVKPDLCATGQGTAYVNSYGYNDFGNGTSYSSPLLAGFMACYLQAYKENISHPYNIQTIINQVVSTADRYHNPDEQYGYGIPDFQEAMENIGYNNLKTTTTDTYTNIKYLSHNKSLEIDIQASTIPIDIKIYSITGTILFAKTISEATTIDLSNFENALYLVQISTDKQSYTQKILIH